VLPLVELGAFGNDLIIHSRWARPCSLVTPSGERAPAAALTRRGDGRQGHVVIFSRHADYGNRRRRIGSVSTT
jgi:hypothetical protein